MAQLTALTLLSCSGGSSAWLLSTARIPCSFGVVTWQSERIMVGSFPQALHFYMVDIYAHKKKELSFWILICGIKHLDTLYEQ
jgi:hypothetical protein